MLVTQRDTPEGLLVSVCDPEVLGETFENGSVSITVEESFYGGEPREPEAVVEVLSRAQVANLVGTEAVELAIEHGFVERANVLDLEGTLHAQFLRM
jgi:hypothetical protein